MKPPYPKRRPKSVDVLRQDVRVYVDRQQLSPLRRHTKR
jgi:hypothetical protein